MDTFYFPKEEPKFYTRLALRKYSRPKPGSPVTNTLQSSIRFPLPTSLQDQYNIDVTGVNMDLLGNSPKDLLGAGKSIMEDFQKESAGGGFSTSKILDIATSAAALAPGVSDTGVGRLAQSQAGVVRNPHLTTIFEGVKLKNFHFTWKISPRSQDEANMLNKCINYIKAYMHPLIVGGGFALEYPYIATLQFVVGDNNTLPNINDSFITDISINSSGGGTIAFFNDGNPVVTEISIGFQEIDIRTRSDFLGSSAGTSN